MITLTAEQAQQIEEALDIAYCLAESGWTEHKYAASLAVIRAVRAQEQAENNDWKKASYIRETLNAEQAEQEPVAWGCKTTEDLLIFQNEKQANLFASKWELKVTPLYAAPVRTKDLTDEEIEWLVVDTLETWNSKDTMKDFARAVIAKYKEKNK